MVNDDKLNELQRQVQQLVSQQKETASAVAILQRDLVAIRVMLEDAGYKTN